MESEAPQEVPKEKEGRIKYDRALLDKVLERDCATLIGDYEKITNKTKITYKCSCGNENTKSLYSLELNPAKCKSCMKVIQKENTVKTLHMKNGNNTQEEKNTNIINKLREIFYDNTYDYSKVNWDGFKKSKITIKCNKHNYEWNSIVESLLLGHGCIKCGRNRTSEIQRKDFVKESIGKFGKGVFDYSLVNYTAAHDKIILKCIKHNNTFENIAREHLISPNGGCQKCYDESRCGSNHFSAINKEELLKRIQQVWGNKFEYDLTDYTHLQSKIKITCKKHNRTWKSTASNHTHSTNPRGCILCSKEDVEQKNLEQYGVRHHQQNPEIFEKQQKNAKKFKEFKMPSGTVRKVQGYEPFALRDLLKTYTEEQIKTDRKEVGRIKYKLECDEKEKYYFPDIYLPHEKKYIEVKSSWTAKQKPEVIEAKAAACREQGFACEIWVYNAKGERVEC